MIFINPLVQMVYFVMVVQHDTCVPTHIESVFLYNLELLTLTKLPV